MFLNSIRGLRFMSCCFKCRFMYVSRVRISNALYLFVLLFCFFILTIYVSVGATSFIDGVLMLIYSYIFLFSFDYFL